MSTTRFDLSTTPLREVNRALHAKGVSGEFVIDNPVADYARRLASIEALAGVEQPVGV